MGIIRHLNYLIIFLLLPATGFAADVYIDPSWGGAESGTFAQPYDSWADVTISAGNDYYQKCGTTATSNGEIIDLTGVSGSSGDRIIIGAYYDGGGFAVHGLSGARPTMEETYTNLAHNNDGDPPGQGKSLLAIENCDYLTFRHIRFKGGFKQIRVLGCNYITFDECWIGDKAYQYGLYILCNLTTGEPSNYGVIKNCIIDSQSDIYGQTGTDEGGEQFDGIIMKYGVNHWQVYGNIIKDWGHNGVGVRSKGDYGGQTCSYNKFYDNLFEGHNDNSRYGRAFGTAWHKNYTQYNEFYHNVFRYWSIQSQIGGGHTRVWGNLFYDYTRYGADDDNHAITISTVDNAAYGHAYAAEIINNTFVNISGVGIFVNARAASKGYESPNECKIINNLLYNCGQDNVPARTNISIWVDQTDDPPFNNEYRNNLSYNTATSNTVLYRGSYYDPDAWNGALLNGDVASNNFEANPQFNNIGAGEFWLTSSSPARDAGIDMGDVFDDGLSKDSTWPGGRIIVDKDPDWDIGAYEFESASDPWSSRLQAVLPDAYIETFNAYTAWRHSEYLDYPDIECSGDNPGGYWVKGCYYDRITADVPDYQIDVHPNKSVENSNSLRLNWLGDTAGHQDLGKMVTFIGEGDEEDGIQDTLYALFAYYLPSDRYVTECDNTQDSGSTRYPCDVKQGEYGLYSISAKIFEASIGFINADDWSDLGIDSSACRWGWSENMLFVVQLGPSNSYEKQVRWSHGGDGFNGGVAVGSEWFDTLFWVGIRLQRESAAGLSDGRITVTFYNDRGESTVMLDSVTWVIGDGGDCATESGISASRALDMGWNWFMFESNWRVDRDPGPGTSDTYYRCRHLLDSGGSYVRGLECSVYVDDFIVSPNPIAETYFNELVGEVHGIGIDGMGMSGVSYGD